MRVSIPIPESSTGLAALLQNLCVAGLALGLASAAQARTETLRWSHTAPPEASGFRVYVGPESGTYTQSIPVGLPNYTGGIYSYDLYVADEETVFVAVAAYNAAGESPLSNERVREPEAGLPPGEDPTPTPAPTPTSSPSPTPPPPDPGSGGAILSEDFQTSAIGQNVPGWVDTKAGNSLVEDDSLFQVMYFGGNRVFGTTSTRTNIHSHYVADGSAGWSAYEFGGRMLITDPSAGIGVTVHSQYTNADAYYRVMRWQGTDFYLEPHPYPAQVQCESSRTGIVPAAGSWYRFRFEVAPEPTLTSIRAKVWADGTNEPVIWQIRCEDTRADRLLSGTVGVWSMASGSKYWDDLEVIAPSGGPQLGRPGQPRIITPQP